MGFGQLIRLLLTLYNSAQHLSHCQLTIYKIYIFQNENGIGSSPDPFPRGAYTASDKALREK